MESPPNVDISDESAVATALMALLEDEVATRFGPDAYPAVHLQAEQLKARLRAFAGKQAEWAAQGWRIMAVECQPEGEGVPFDVDGTPFFLRGRIDRIDHNPATGKWAVLDYKTGALVDPPEQAHRKGEGEDQRWINLQLPLYRRLLAGIVDDQGRPIVDTEAIAHRDLYLGYVALPKETAKTNFMLARWSEEDLATAEATAREAVRHLRAGVFEFDRDRTRVGRFGGDALEPLLKVGWQAPVADEDAGEDESTAPGYEPSDDRSRS